MSYRGLSADEERFYAGMIDRENRQRLAWFLKHRGHLIQQQEQQLLDEAKVNKEERREAVFSPPPPRPLGPPVLNNVPSSMVILQSNLKWHPFYASCFSEFKKCFLIN